MKTNAAEGGALAHLNFRVRCETLGHGEGVFLIRSTDPHLTRVSYELDVVEKSQAQRRKIPFASKWRNNGPNVMCGALYHVLLVSGHVENVIFGTIPVIHA